MVELLALAVVDVACGLLITAGVMKLSGGRRPFDRLVGSVEVAVGLAVFGVGGTAAFVAMSLLYGGLAVAAARSLQIAAPSCDCFGANSAPPSRAHVVVNAIVASVAGVLVATDPRPLVDRLGPGIGAGVAYLAFIVAGTATAYALFTGASELASARRLVARP